MKFNNFAAVAIAVSLMVAPVAVQAADAIAPAVERVGATADTEAEKLEGTTGILVALLGAAAVIAGIIIIADDDDPTSP